MYSQTRQLLENPVTGGRHHDIESRRVEPSSQGLNSMSELFLIPLALWIPALLESMQPAPDPVPAMARAMGLLRDPDFDWLAPSRNGVIEHRLQNRLVSPATGLSALGFRDEGSKLSLGQQHDLDLARLDSKLELMATPANIPWRRNGWKSEESLKLPLTGGVFVIGQLGADSADLEQQQYKLVGRTGVGATLPSGGEIQLRHIRSMTNYDPDDFNLIREQARSSFEISLRWKLPGDLSLQYTDETISAQQAMERDTRKQDLRLAFPLSGSGQFHIGARYHSPDSAVPTTWVERMQLYLGVQWKR
jgi:hypothetical protein